MANEVFKFIAGSDIDLVSGVAGTRTGRYKDDTKVGIALDCDGSTTKLLAPLALNLNSDWSVEIYVNVTKFDNPSWDALFSLSDISGVYNNGLVLTLNRVLGLYTDASPFTLSISPAITDTKYKHVLLTYNNTSKVLSVIINNEINNSVVLTKTLKTVTYLTIASQGVTRYLGGSVERTVVYSNDLTQSERNQLYTDFLWALRTGRKGFKKTNLLDREIFNSKATKDIDPNTVARWSYKKAYLGDISGNGYTLTNVGAIPTIRGYKFTGLGVYQTFTSINLGTVYTFSIRCTLEQLAVFILGDNSNNNYFYLWTPTVIHHRSSSGTIAVFNPSGITLGIAYTFTLIRNGNSCILVMNGSQVGTAQPISGDFVISQIGAKSNQTPDQEIEEVYIRSDVWTLQQAKDYHNQFANLNTLYDRTEGEAVGNPPRDWRKGTATSLTVEEITNSSCNLPIGTKYVKIGTATKTCYIENNEMTQLVSNGYADYWYYTAATNQFAQRTGLIGVVAGLSYASGRLTFTAAANGDGFAASYPYEMKIKAGVQV